MTDSDLEEVIIQFHTIILKRFQRQSRITDYIVVGKILDWSMHTNEIQLTEAKIQIRNQAQYNNNSPHRWYSLEEIEHGVLLGRLQSSNRRKNKILRAAIEVHEDYERSRTKLEKAKSRCL